MENKLTPQNVSSPLEELSFDMRLYFYRELHQIRLRLIECSASGDLNGWFEMLEREYMHVLPHIFPQVYDVIESKESKKDEKENDCYETSFKKIANLLYSNAGDSQLEQLRRLKNNQIARAELVMIEKKLNIAMQKRNMLLPTEKRRGKKIDRALKI